jgi:plastocyanin
VPAGIVLLILQQGAALATTKDVSITNFQFSPTPLAVAQGGSVLWTNNTTGTNHTSSNDTTNPDNTTGLGLWDSGVISPSSTFIFTFTAAGRYTYHCNIHPFMTAMVTVKPNASPSTGSLGTAFKITWATVAATGNFVYDVQKRDPNGTFLDWMTGVTSRRTMFMPTATGTYSFRARLRNSSTGGASEFSPVKSIMVT